MTKRRRRRARGKVDRSERVLPPPEAAQHHRPWPMQELLQLGHPDGIDADEFEAALQIVETFHILTLETGERHQAMEQRIGISRIAYAMSDRDAERCACWFDWSSRLPARLPTRLVAWIEDEQPVGSVEVLRRACRLWDRVRSDRAKPRVAGVDMAPRHVLTIAPPQLRQADIAASPVNRLTGAFFPPPGLLPKPLSLSPAGAQLRQSAPRPVAGPCHANTTAHPPTGRLRR